MTDIPAAVMAAWLAFAGLHADLPVPPNAHPVVTVGRMVVPTDEAETFSDGRIVFPRPYTGTVEEQCTLAHELTHWLQFQDGKVGPEWMMEPPAYEVTADCLEQFGRTQEAEARRMQAVAFAAHGPGSQIQIVRIGRRR